MRALAPNIFWEIFFIMGLMLRDEASRWLSEALWDIDTASILIRAKRYNASAFYSHQAAEKAVKALLYSLNESAWGHSIRILMQRYSEITVKTLTGF